MGGEMFELVIFLCLWRKGVDTRNKRLRQRVQTDCWTHFAFRPGCTERLWNV